MRVLIVWVLFLGHTIENHSKYRRILELSLCAFGEKVRSGSRPHHQKHSIDDLRKPSSHRLLESRETNRLRSN